MGIANSTIDMVIVKTPYMYGNDKVMDTLHTNAEIDMAKMEYEYLWYNCMLNSLSGSSSFSIGYTWFVDMTFTECDYKWNSDWQVGCHSNNCATFNGLDMNINNNWKVQSTEGRQGHPPLIAILSSSVCFRLQYSALSAQ